MEDCSSKRWLNMPVVVAAALLACHVGNVSHQAVSSLRAVT